MKKFFRKISMGILIFTIPLFFSLIYAKITLPDIYNVTEECKYRFEIFPCSVTTSFNDGIVNVSSCASDCKNFKEMKAQLKLFDIFPVKTVMVNSVPKRFVKLSGKPFGAKIYTDGIIVIDIPESNFVYGQRTPAQISGIKKGDIILKANGKKITSTDQFESIVNSSRGEEIDIEISRNDQIKSIVLKPEINSEDGKYYTGMWVRDSSAGIGTMTFYDEKNGMFGGLGHGICDVDTGNMLSVFKGSIDSATIMGIKKGSPGNPGELSGYFDFPNSIGKIYSNGATGLYGRLNNYYDPDSKEIEVARKQEIKKGEAKIFSTIDGNTPNFYDIKIDHIDYNTNIPTKNIKFTVTDQELINATGGIVQGMSGSPIVQDNRLVGAITHVFVNNPTKGYGIFSETMLTNSDKISETHDKNNIE